MRPKIFTLLMVSALIALVLLLQPIPFPTVSAADLSAPPAAVAVSVPIVFVSRHHPDTLDGVHVGPPVEILGREKIVGGTLQVLYPDGRVVNLTAGTPIYDVQRPSVSFDGTKVLFSGVQGPRDLWHIYEIGLDGTGFRQLTFNDRAITIPDDPRDPGRNAVIFRRYGDFAPVYLPDGRILFASMRYPAQSGSCGQRAVNLYVMNADGSGLHRVTTFRAGAIDPYVLASGRVALSHWVDNMNIPARAGGGLEPLEWYRNYAPSFWILWSMHPDGSEAGRYAFNGGTFADSGGIFQAREMPDGRIVYTYRAAGNLLGSTLATSIAILNPGVGAGNTTRGIGDPANDQAAHALSPAPLPDGRVLFSYTPTATVTQQSNGQWTATFNYGLYLTDGNLKARPTLVYDNPDTEELDAIAVYSRTAQVIPDLPDAANVTDDPTQDLGTTTTLINRNVYADLPLTFKEILAPQVGAIVAVDFYDDSQTFTTSDEFPLLRKQMPRLITSVPVNADGSFTATIPADRPIFWIMRGPSGAVARMASSPEKPGGQGETIASYVPTHDFFRPGTVIQCTGCHRGHMIRPDLAFTVAQTNLARVATARASSQLDVFYHSAERVNDNRLAPKGSDRYEWASKSARGAWVQLDWALPINATEIVLYPRLSSNSRVISATLSFSDGSSVPNIGLSKGSQPITVPLGTKNFSWVRFTIDKSTGKSPGLAEMVVHGSPAIEFSRDAPAAPKGLTTTDGTILLNWTRNRETNLAGYKVYYGTAPGQYTQSLDVGNASWFLVPGLSDGTTYYFALKAYNLAGIASTAFSNEVSATARAPVVTSIEPNHGPVSGFTRVTIRGRNFAPRGVIVLIGDDLLRDVKVVNPTTITGLTWPHAAGAFDVTVINPDDAQGVLKKGYTFE